MKRYAAILGTCAASLYPTGRSHAARSYYPASYPRHNIAEGKPVRASSVYDARAENLAANATDGTVLTSWTSDLKQATGWLEIDLGAKHTIDKMRIEAWQNARKFAVLASVDGRVWKTAYASSEGLGFMRFTFPPVDARYLRMDFLEQNGHGEGFSVREIQVFEKGVPFDLPEFGFGYAFGKPVKASSAAVDKWYTNEPGFAVDEWFSSYWLNQGAKKRPGYDAAPWLTIDLESVKTIAFIRWVTWESDCKYQILTSADGSAWSLLADKGRSKKNQIKEMTLPAPVKARYVKFQGAHSESAGEYTELSLRAVQVAGPEGLYGR